MSQPNQLNKQEATATLKKIINGDGAYEKDWSNLLDDATYDPAKLAWKDSGGNMVYLLRPIKPLAD